MRRSLRGRAVRRRWTPAFVGANGRARLTPGAAGGQEGAAGFPLGRVRRKEASRGSAGSWRALRRGPREDGPFGSGPGQGRAFCWAGAMPGDNSKAAVARRCIFIAAAGCPPLPDHPFRCNERGVGQTPRKDPRCGRAAKAPTFVARYARHATQSDWPAPRTPLGSSCVYSGRQARLGSCRPVASFSLRNVDEREIASRIVATHRCSGRNHVPPGAGHLKA